MIGRAEEAQTGMRLRAKALLHGRRIRSLDVRVACAVKSEPSSPALGGICHVRRAHFGRIDEVKRISPLRPRRLGRAPWRDEPRQAQPRFGLPDVAHGHDTRGTLAAGNVLVANQLGRLGDLKSSKWLIYL